MGQSCCFQKDQQIDLRETRGNRVNNKKGFEQNTFKQQPKEPEFVVQRRDSIGMAAKEHTEKMMDGRMKDDNIRKSLNSQNTDGDRNVSDSAQNANVFTEGTFAEQGELGRILQEETNQQNPYEEDEHDIPKHSLGSVSFGATNRKLFMQDNSIEYRHNRVSNSITSNISIRDIQEVSDKLPASPATASKPNQEYFK